MRFSCPCSSPIARRLSIGLTLLGCVILGLSWIVYSSQPSTANTPEATSQQRAVAAQPAFTAGEILARFPQAKHDEFMRRAIANSRKAGVEYKTGGAFGAVIVTKDGTVIADGLNQVIGENDPTWHGEMHAIRQACSLLKSPKLHGCILYTSSEPCPMCLATAYWAGVDGIIYGATVADSKKYGNFDDAFIYAQLAKQNAERSIPEATLLRDEAVKVWKEYQARRDKVDY